MIAIDVYRCRIGTFYQKVKFRCKASSINRFDKKHMKNIYPCMKILKYLQTLLKILLVMGMVLACDSHEQGTQIPQVHGHAGHYQGHRLYLSVKGLSHNFNSQDCHSGDNQLTNFYARYTYGNKTNQKGIKTFILISDHFQIKSWKSRKS